MASAVQDAWLKDVLHIDPGAADPAGGGGNVGARQTAVAQAAKAWAEAEAKIRADLATLGKHVAKSYEDDEDGPEGLQVFAKHLDGIFSIFDSSLASDLAQASKAKDDAELDGICADIRKAVDQMTASVASDPIIALIDDNPYSPVAVVATCHAAFEVLADHV